MKQVFAKLGRARYFIWVIIPVLLFLMFKVVGLPHLAFNYTYRDDGRGYEPFAPGRWYVTCTYIGYYGHFKYTTNDGTCPWFKFYKENAGGKI